MELMIANATIVTMNERMEVIFGGFLVIEGGKICYLGRKAPETPPEKIIDGTGMVLLPGLHDCHTQLAGVLFRDYGDGWGREEREFRYRQEMKLDERAVKAASQLAIAERLRQGVTCVSDLYFFTDAVAEAAAESGIKANLCRAATYPEAEEEDFDVENDPGCQEFLRLQERWDGYDAGRIRMDAGFLSPETSNYHLWEAMAGLAAEGGQGFQCALAETKEERERCLDRYGLSPAELLACHGVLGPKTCFFGLAGAEEAEIAAIAKGKASAVLCPGGAGYLGEQEPGLLPLARAGINVCLGSGRAGKSDLFEAMALLQRQARQETGDPKAAPAAGLLMTATVCGAKAHGREKECGMLKIGMDADLIMLDFTAPHLMPCHNVMTALVSGARGSDVVMTMVRGKILYAAGEYKTIDLNKVVQELAEYAMPHIFGEEKQNPKEA